MSDLARIIRNPPEADMVRLHGEILECSIAAANNGNYRNTLKKRRAEAKGGLKKIYAAMYKASPKKLVRMADAFISEFNI